VSKASFDEEREERQLPEDRGKMTRVEFFGNIPKIVRREAFSGYGSGGRTREVTKLRPCSDMLSQALPIE
jgi:hypothetical protein